MLAEKVIVITGGAGLLGRKFCEGIAAQGATVIVADLDVVAASAVAQVIRGAGFNALSHQLDITDSASIECLITGLDKEYGRIDAVVNNAYPRNKNYGRKLEEVSYKDFCENMNLHLGGYFLVSQMLAKYFSQQEFGNIVNIASIYGVMAPRFEVYAGTKMTMPVEYAAIKAGVIQLTRYFAQYYKKSGVRCNTLSPGGILDKQPDSFLDQYNKFCGVKGMLGSDDILGALIFLLSDQSQYINGQNIVIDDGFSL